MKTSLLVAASAVALFAAAPAFAQSVGSVGASYSHSDVDLGGLSGDADAWTVDGQVAFGAGSVWTVTVDADVTYSDDADDTTVAGTVHGTRMFGDSLRAGGFAGATELGDEILWAVGAEFQKYVGDFTWGGQLAYGQIDDVDADIWGLRGDVAYFVSDNFRLDGGVGYSKVDFGPVDGDAWSVGVGGEYQFAGTPFSVFGGYDHAKIDDLDVSADTFEIGLRYSFGGGLRARERGGAALGSGVQALAAGLGL